MTSIPDKNSKLAPGLAVDGVRVRAIREEKKLTQLYVASIVGVTTDTISRWENNRYPSIKRDNAEKLARALEVELEEILIPEPVPSEVPVKPLRRRRLLLIVLALAAALVAALLYLVPSSPPVTATRWLPRFSPPGEIAPVQIKVSRVPSGKRGVIIRERLPAGWRFVSGAPLPSPGQAAEGELKWLIPGGDGNVTISYTTAPPVTAPANSPATFSGTIVVHEADGSHGVEIGGSREITVAPHHWADGDGDGRIDDNEIMPAYYLTEELKGLGLDWGTIEAIWNGKGYRWDQAGGRFEVVR
jgi:transcriptional regulator with XRE-family HTH domain